MSFNPDEPASYLHEDPAVKAMVEGWDDISLFYPLNVILMDIEDYISKQAELAPVDSAARELVVKALLDPDALESFVTQLKSKWEIPWKMDIVSALGRKDAG